MQLAAERIFRHLGVKARPVPFGGAGETARNFLGGHVDLYGGSLPPILPHVAAGKAKCLMLTSADGQSGDARRVGTDALGVAGAGDGAVVGADRAEGPAGRCVETLDKAFREAVASPRFKETMEKQGADTGRAQLQGDG